MLILGVAFWSGLTTTAGFCTYSFPVWVKSKKSDTPLFRFAVDGKAGYIDPSGRVVIAPRFRHGSNYGGDFFEGLARVDKEDGTIIFINSSGEEVNLNGTIVSSFSEGVAIFLAGESKGERWAESRKYGYIDRQGKVVIPARFDRATEFSEGLAAVTINHQVGYIDHQGRFAIEPRLLLGESFQNGAARVVAGGPCKFYRPTSCDPYPPVLPDSKEFFTQNAAPPTRRCEFSFIDKQGRLLFEKSFEQTGIFSEGLAAVKEENLWGYVDKSGKVQIPFTFDYAGPFSEGLARVLVRDSWGYIDSHGSFVITPRFAWGDDFSEGVAVVNTREGQSYSGNYFIDRYGNQAVPDQFMSASSFVMGLAHVQRLDGKHAYIDRKGKAVITYTEMSRKK
jgi:hypothetical protein